MSSKLSHLSMVQTQSNKHFLTQNTVDHLTCEIFKVNTEIIDYINQQGNIYVKSFIKPENYTGIPNSCSINTIFNMLAANHLHFRETGIIYTKIKMLMESNSNERLGNMQDIGIIVAMATVVNCNLLCICLDDCNGGMTKGDIYKTIINPNWPWIYVVNKSKHYSLANITSDICLMIYREYYNSIKNGTVDNDIINLEFSINKRLETSAMLSTEINNIRNDMERYLNVFPETLEYYYNHIHKFLEDIRHISIIKDVRMIEYINLWDKNNEKLILLYSSKMLQVETTEFKYIRNQLVDVLNVLDNEIRNNNVCTPVGGCITIYYY